MGGRNSCLSRRFLRCPGGIAGQGGGLAQCAPRFLRATQWRNDQVEISKSRATFTMARPELTNATASSLNAASYRRPRWLFRSWFLSTPRGLLHQIEGNSQHWTEEPAPDPSIGGELRMANVQRSTL